MTDSAYAALMRRSIFAPEPSVLFLKRSNGQLWLPGGKIDPEVDVSPKEVVVKCVATLLKSCDWTPRDVGMWRLSPEAGGHAVYLFGGEVDDNWRAKLNDRSNGLSHELMFLDRERIRYHVYEKGDMPWGQAKMAVYFLYAFFRVGERVDGELLKADLGELDGLTWNRPE